jgi:hypothetical protein
VIDFSTPLSPIDRLSKQKLIKNTPELNDTIDQMALTDMYRVFHPAMSPIVWSSRQNNNNTKKKPFRIKLYYQQNGLKTHLHSILSSSSTIYLLFSSSWKFLQHIPYLGLKASPEYCLNPME